MNALSVFDFEDHAVRAFDVHGEPWFVLVDVCRILEVGNASDAARRLDDDEKATLDTVEGSREQVGTDPRATIINESGLYSLILTSRKPEAKRFKKWVTSVLLPTLRKTGHFHLAANDTVAVQLAADTEARQLSSRISAVREARSMGGIVAGKRMWAALGLPDVFGSTEVKGDDLAAAVADALERIFHPFTIDDLAEAMSLDIAPDFNLRCRLGNILRSRGYERFKLRRGRQTVNAFRRVRHGA